MPRFYFNVVGDDLHWTDVAGRHCGTLEAARLEARRIAAEIVSNALISGQAPPDAVVEVEDQQLRPVLELPVMQAVH